MEASALPNKCGARIHGAMRISLSLLVPLILLALPWNSCSRNKLHLSNNGQSQLRTGDGYFNPPTEKKSTTKRAFKD